ncbi:transcription elongation factor SPT5 [Nematocida sp. AWRm80]|nr:transcription elongation factor SPT5 [Nematocida sp. AWRm80]
MGKRKSTIASESEEEYDRNKFVDVEASEEEDEEEEDEESLGDFINEIEEEIETEEEKSLEKEKHTRIKEESIDDFEQYTKKIEERYMHADEPLEVEELSQQMLLPTDKSPRLWLIRCTPKKERHIVLAIMRKCISAEKAETPIQITSVLTNECINGYIYIEAYQKQQVLSAIDGINGAFRTSITQVPSKEMSEVLFIPELDPVLYKEGNFLRITKGKYAGDIAQVDRLSQTKGMITMLIIPRIGAQNKQELFVPSKYPSSEVYRVSKNTYVYKKETYKDGYLVKDIHTANMSPTPQPTAEEKKHFVSAQGLDPVIVSKGEFVEIVHGGLKGVTGTIINVSPEEVLLKIEDRTVTVSLQDIKKRYSLGDEVTIISGRKRGNSGFIVGISENNKLRVGINGFTEEIEVLTEEVKLGTLLPTTTTTTKPPQQHLKHKRDPLIHKQGTITAGEHKGKKGIVKDTQGTNLQVQLLTNLKYVFIPREAFLVRNKYETEEPSRPERGSDYSFAKDNSEYITPSTPQQPDHTPSTPPLQDSEQEESSTTHARYQSKVYNPFSDLDTER